eukprot:9004155-Alexandrium_andersonii.AAC.1
MAELPFPVSGTPANRPWGKLESKAFQLRRRTPGLELRSLRISRAMPPSLASEGFSGPGSRTSE